MRLRRIWMNWVAWLLAVLVAAMLLALFDRKPLLSKGGASTTDSLNILEMD